MKLDFCTKIYQSNRSVILKTNEEDSDLQYILKSVNTSSTDEKHLVSLRNELELSKIVDFEGIRKAERLEKIDGRTYLLLPYCEGNTLHDFFTYSGGQFSVFFEVAIQMAELLTQLHSKYIIHKDISAGNFIVSPKNKVTLIDLAGSSRYSFKLNDFTAPERLEGTLPYMSPEQTGRMNRNVDIRSDLYSLGVLFYEMLTGKLPFNDPDLMKIIHFHIAVPPKPLLELRSEVPVCLSRIVARLMEKNAEDRYQSAYGLKRDLEYAYGLYQSGILDAEFELGKEDHVGGLVLPEKLYGRSFELEQLMNTYDKVSNGLVDKAQILVGGYSGTGKSLLVREIYKPVTESNAIFIEGKFSEFQKHQPYSAIVEAFKQFAQYILKSEDTHFNYWKNLLNQALGSVGKVITQMIPELEHVMGEQPELPTVNVDEAKNRFNYAWTSFVQAIASEKHPLVLFIDDLQWADNASLQLLSMLLNEVEIKYFLNIGAFRDNEIDENPGAKQHLEDLSQVDIPVVSFGLKNLSQEDVTFFLSDCFVSREGSIEDLAKLICQKTYGNAFFTTQLVKELYEEQLIRFDYENKAWQWDVLQIENRGYSDNVLTLMTTKFERLDIKTQGILKVASCIGSKFSLKDLIIVHGGEADEILQYLDEAIFEGLVLALPQDANFKFAHDKVQQAIYESFSEDKRREAHLKTGRLLLENSKAEGAGKLPLFSIVSHLNFAASLITDKEEKIQLIDLNIEATKEAQQASAYGPAISYLTYAKDYLGKQPWEADPKRSMLIFRQLSELFYMSSQYAEAEKYAKIVIDKASDIYDEAAGYQTLIFVSKAKGLYKDAVGYAIQVLGKLGFELPEKVTQGLVGKELLKTMFLMRKYPIERIKKLPILTDRKHLQIVAINDVVMSAIFLLDKNMYALIIMKQMRFMMKNGFCEYNIRDLTNYGLVMATMNRFKTSEEYVQVAKDISLERSYRKTIPNIVFVQESFVFSAKKRIHDVYPKIEKAYYDAVELGDNEIASYCLSQLSVFYLYGNRKLDVVRDEMVKLFPKIKQYNQDVATEIMSIHLQVYENLTAVNNTSDTLTGKFYNEEKAREHYIETDNLSVLANALQAKLLMLFLMDRKEDWMSVISDFKKYEEYSKLSYVLVVFYFYHSLCLLQLYPEMSKGEKKKALKQVKKNQKVYAAWSKRNPEGLKHRHLLIEAELNKVLGKDDLANKYYLQAIEQANRFEYIQDEGIAWELYAQYQQVHHNTSLARNAVLKAYECFELWGAESKLTQLLDKYPDLLIGLHKNMRGNFTTSNIASMNTQSFHTTERATSQSIDLSSLLKASHALGKEVKLSNLLSSMLNVIMENAGGKYAVILKSDNGRFYIEARGHYDNDNFSLLEHKDIEGLTEPLIPTSIVKYTIRSQAPLVLDNASVDSHYSHDEYIKLNKVKSLLCYPIIHNNRILAVLYLENNLTSHAFTENKVETVKLLSAQLAISLENTLLYQNLEQKVEQRTEELSTAKKEIERHNQQMTDSINYAQRIQQAVLPEEKLFADNFKGHFIFYSPKNIVSGDFYWTRRVGDYVVFTAADCTGHGVPGAFVSMLGISTLNEIVNPEQKMEAGHILDLLRNGVKTSLKQTSDSEVRNRDGMDISLCVLNLKTKEISYAGAFNPLYIMRGKEFIQFKANRQPIGKHLKEVPFETHYFQAQEGDKLYLFSDGYIDQFGGDSNRKYLKKNFIKFLKEISDMSMAEQGEAIQNDFINWKGNHSQVDDILVLGVEIA